MLEKIRIDHEPTILRSSEYFRIHVSCRNGNILGDGKFVLLPFMEGKLGQPTFQQMPKERVPMVSIMVPCYNEGDNLDKAIPYLLQLRYPNYELIFINDGSKDNTGEIIDRWAKLMSASWRFTKKTKVKPVH